jgi:Nucleotidyl transferase AbiEii toxin, Type IV TA system
VTKPLKDIAASVRQRLQNAAKAAGRPFQEVLEYYAMERFLYRLGRSPHAKRFVLKGALMFRTWGGPASRPTRDIDLLAYMENTVDAVVKVFQEMCAVDVQPDGMVFDPASVAGAVIKEDADYSGVRVTFRGTLQNARVAMQADLGFADVVTPGPVPTDYPVILEFPAPRLAGYTRETVVAEKFEAMVKLGELNSRMKDFFDLWLLARQFDFDGATLGAAVARTFAIRKTAVVPNPLALSPAFAAVPGKEAQWKGFVRKAKLLDVPSELSAVVTEIGGFLLPVAAAVLAGDAFRRTWRAPGPWA